MSNGSFQTHGTRMVSLGDKGSGIALSQIFNLVPAGTIQFSVGWVVVTVGAARATATRGRVGRAVVSGTVI